MTRPKKSPIWLLPDEEFIALVQSNFTKKDIIVAIGIPFSTSHYKTLDARLKEMNLDISHFNPAHDLSRKRMVYTMEQILVENSTYNNNYNLKQRIFAEGLLKQECAFCGLGTTWQGKPISLQLDHINGVNNDNRLINLRILCPNCHSQTETFGTRNWI